MDSVSQLRDALSDDVLVAAPMLLGWEIVLGDLRSRIVEVEAYRTPDDPGCHAHNGKGKRCATMYEAPGTTYVYFTYGNHFMLNIAAHPIDVAAAILIRAARPLAGLDTFWSRRPKAVKETDLLSGPGKLTAAYGINFSFDRGDLLDGTGLHLVPGPAPKSILVGTRIGLHPDKGADFPWRFASGDDIHYVSWASRLRGEQLSPN